MLDIKLAFAHGMLASRRKRRNRHAQPRSRSSIPDIIQRGTSWALAGDSWESLAPTPNHPAAGLSWEDAHAFCQWLTSMERESGLLGSDEFHRLPTDAEWSVAEGKGPYIWGSEFPLLRR